MNKWSWTAFFMRGVGGSLGGQASGSQSPSSPNLGGVNFNGAKVYLHFFPVANGVSAPYPIHAFIEIFCRGQLLARQGFEGLRLNQPDGLDLADVFPDLFRNPTPSSIPASREAPTSVYGAGKPVTTTEEFSRYATGEQPSSSGQVAERKPFPRLLEKDEILRTERELGISIELATTQPRLDLSRSRVLVEVCYPSHRVRYHAARASEKSSSHEISLYRHDGYETRLVEVSPFCGEPQAEGASALSDVSRDVRGESGPSTSRQASRTLRSVSLEKRHGNLPSGAIRDGEFLSAGRLPKALPDDDGGAVGEGSAYQQEQVARFLVQYEATSSLPVSVRCL